MKKLQRELDKITRGIIKSTKKEIKKRIKKAQEIHGKLTKDQKKKLRKNLEERVTEFLTNQDPILDPSPAKQEINNLANQKSLVVPFKNQKELKENLIFHLSQIKENKLKEDPIPTKEEKQEKPSINLKKRMGRPRKDVIKQIKEN